MRKKFKNYVIPLIPTIGILIILGQLFYLIIFKKDVDTDDFILNLRERDL